MGKRERKQVVPYNPETDGANDSTRLNKKQRLKKASTKSKPEARPGKSKPRAKKSSNPNPKPKAAVQLPKSAYEYDCILTKCVDELAQMVDDDWHDGYEEQSEKCCEWFSLIREPLQAVLDIGVGDCSALEQCGEVLRVVAGSYDNLLSCDMRGGDSNITCCDMAEIELDTPWGSFELRLSSTTSTWRSVWVALLRTHANAGADQAVLLQAIKDASDHNCASLSMEDYCLGLDEEDAPPGDKLAALLSQEKAWKGLKSRKKKYKQREPIDRRFDGTPERRTRDYHLHSDDDVDYFGFPYNVQNGYGSDYGSDDGYGSDYPRSYTNE